MDILLLLFFFIGCFLVTFLERKSLIPFLKWFFILPFCFILANRSLKVPDTEAYYEYFYDSDYTSIDDFSHSSFEIGFQFFSKVIKVIVGDNFVFYLAIITLLNLLIIDFATKRISYLFEIEQKNSGLQDCFYGKNRFLSNSYFSIIPLTLYVAYFGIYTNAIVLRVGIAISLLVLIVSYALKERKSVLDIFKIVGLFVLGYFFHATMLLGIFVVLIMFINKSFPQKRYLWICFIIGFVYFSNLSTLLSISVFSFITSLNELTVLASKMSSYEGNVVQEVGGISNKFVFYWVMAFVLIFYSSSSKIYFKLLNVYLVGLAIFALFRSVILIERVTDYFLTFSFIIFYIFLITQKPHKFWLFFIPIVIVQLVFVLRITN
ncbi:EpsG family protein [Flavobacterium sp. Fl-77]|uniref:EpsG family protein n=1 Tax=Flavobacterium flavipigmentatum TaxID=2893884 RepID=A0AAJ2SB56_9FLAO|nr:MULTISPECIES: EpsG family protein [unclassified Flavobacterium]MDX6182203.1 EpsG family protein [Flavobacterium sp. Fl-33]MDX6185884.1 EpsG family protein [Flavobacterium sp. Fl-77]UFH39062.1 EpsG family protein [Flavobacterium sp. F-70]